VLIRIAIGLLSSLILLTSVSAQSDTATADTSASVSVKPPRPATILAAEDAPNDHGHAIVLRWGLSPDDTAGDRSVLLYEILRWTPDHMTALDSVNDSLDRARGRLNELESADTSTGAMVRQAESEFNRLQNLRGNLIDQIPEAFATYPENGQWMIIDTALSGQDTSRIVGVKESSSKDYLADFTDYYFRVDVVAETPGVKAASNTIGPVQSRGQWYNSYRTPALFAVLIFSTLTIIYVKHAKSGKDLYVRPLSGIDAVDDAIGRATEMGKPILYVLGLGTAADIATIASFTILARVAKRVAEYQTHLIVPTYDPIVMTVAQETVKAAYSDAGRPDAYSEDIVYFVTQSQFAYVAAVNGTMLRELPATNVYMGKFYAESLLLAETGALAGSIQIAGTDEIAQLPFFIVACDYTLIGEEMYAASAYLSREPILLGSLKAQDYAKAAIIVFGFLGFVAAQFEWNWFTSLFKVLG
jgi:hypothetical protein